MTKKLTILCKSCNNERTFENKYSVRGIYCSHKCQQDYQHKTRIDKWLNENIVPDKRVIKRHIIESRGNMCEECGITEWNNKSIVFELEHIDGNSENNNLENLSLICPNCHSQTSTYKNRNKGNGRHSRRVRYAEGKSY